MNDPSLIPVRAHPIDLFEEWLSEAVECEALSEPYAGTLVTVDEQAMPWPRVILLRGLSNRGFVFYTNLTSIKGRHIDQNPRAALSFYWMPLNRQVRILGNLEQVSDEEADHYFASRPRESQLGAWASKQSQPLDSRNTLLLRVAKYAERFGEGEVPRPPFWSGYRLDPTLVEFWLHQPFRLHDRLEYSLNDREEWVTNRLYP